MAKFECSVCGYIFDEQQAGMQFSEIDVCPICNESRDVFKRLEEEEVKSENKEENAGEKVEIKIEGDAQKAEAEMKKAKEELEKREAAEKEAA
jgi:rubredoxin